MKQQRTIDRYEKIVALVNEYSEFWPLTVRAWHYRLFAAGINKNTIADYARTSRDLTYLRKAGLLEWGCICDNLRSVNQIYKHTDALNYIQAKISYLPQLYQRCLQQQSSVNLRVIVEKNTMEAQFNRICKPLCIPVDCTRGQSSTTYTKELSDWMDGSQKPPVLLVASDYDNAGKIIAKSVINRVKGLCSVPFKSRRIMLTSKQVKKYDLPLSPDKTGIQKGVVELDAIHPHDLEKILLKQIGKFCDLSAIEEERRIYTRELQQLTALVPTLQKAAERFFARVQKPST